SAPCPVNTHANISVRYDSPRRKSAPVCDGCAYDQSVAVTPIINAQTSMRLTARPTSPRRSASTMNGKLAAVLRNGRRTGTPIAHPIVYESTVAATSAIGTINQHKGHEGHKGHKGHKGYEERNEANLAPNVVCSASRSGK